MPQALSTYFFIGKLSDPSARYQLQRKNGKLKTGFIFEVFLNGIALHGSTEIPFDELKNNVRDTLDTLIAIFVFVTGKPLSYVLDNWTEAKQARIRNDEIGWFVSHTSRVGVSKEQSKINQPWRKAVWLYNHLHQGNNNHKLALKDYHQAVSDTSTDAFFYAYRAIEDICRAVTSATITSPQAWNTMHSILDNQTSQRMISPLLNLATEIRHGKTESPSIMAAKQQKKKYIRIAKKVITVELQRTFPRFFQIN